MQIFIENEAETELGIENLEQVIENAVECVANDKCLPDDLEVNVLLTDAEAMREINNETRGIDNPTDVLSFPYFEYDEPGVFSEEISDDGEYILGDIIICAEKVIAQAEEYGHSRLRELSFLIVHSMLHLTGYDHMVPSDAEIMQAEEKRLMEILGISR